MVKIGDKVRFWNDKWLRDGVLKYRYPRIYVNSLCKKITLGQLEIWKGRDLERKYKEIEVNMEKKTI